jgi:hypothetical protein
MALKPFALILCLHVAVHHVANSYISPLSTVSDCLDNTAMRAGCTPLLLYALPGFVVNKKITFLSGNSSGIFGF